MRPDGNRRDGSDRDDGGGKVGMASFLALQTARGRILGAGIVAWMIVGCSSPPVAIGIFDVSPEWTLDTLDEIIATPRVIDHTILLHTEKQVIAIDGLTRRTLWIADSPGSIYGSAPPVAADGVVVVPEDSNPFAAFDLATGALLWRKCFLAPYTRGRQDCSQASPGIYY